MKGNAQVLNVLNQRLAEELTAISMLDDTKSGGKPDDKPILSDDAALSVRRCIGGARCFAGQS